MRVGVSTSRVGGAETYLDRGIHIDVTPAWCDLFLKARDPSKFPPQAEHLMMPTLLSAVMVTLSIKRGYCVLIGWIC